MAPGLEPNSPFGIGRENHPEIVLVAEGAVLLDSIGGNADDDRAQALELGHQVGELDVLERAAFSIILRIKV